MSDFFAMPGALPFLLLAPLAWLGLTGLDRLRERRLARMLRTRRSRLTREMSRSWRRTRRIVTSTCLALALLAVAQPRWGVDLRRSELRGIDLLVCLDVSRSMLARDLRPSRLARAQSEIRALSEHVRGDRMALVAFAGEARLLSPLTRDLRSFAEIVELAVPTSVELGGTDLGAALQAALEGLDVEDSDHRSVLLITDGEDLAQRGLAVAEECRQRGVVVHCLGIGSRLGSKIPVSAAGTESFLRSRTGEEVVSTMDATGLRTIAQATGGGFFDASSSEHPLIELYDEQILPMARNTFESDDRRERKNRFQWPLLAAFLLWIFEFSTTDRSRR